MTKLDANDPAVLKALEEAGVKPVSNKDKPKPVGTSKKVSAPVVKTDEEAEALIKETEKRTKVSIELTTREVAALQREARVKEMNWEQYLNQLVNEMLEQRVGKSLITSPSWAKKVQAPSLYK